MMNQSTFTDAEIGRFLKHRVCSRCYGDLAKREAPNRTWEAYCPNCGDAWGNTTIARSTAERRGQQAISEGWEVRDNLVDIIPNPHRGKSSEQLLSDLGY